MNQPAFVAVAVLLACGSYGWGRVTLDALERCGAADDDLATTCSGPLVTTVGIASILVIGGVAVAAGVARFPVLLAILLVGAAVAAAQAVTAVRRRGVSLPRPRTVLVGASFAVIAFLAYGETLVGPINPNDDDPGYVYLAYRLLNTGGLLDPFSLRRITSYGGGEIFEAIFVRAGGSGAALGMEWFFSVLLVTALLVRHVSRPFAPVVALLAGLCFTVVHPVGIWANSAPTFSGVALTLALFQLLAEEYRGRSWRYEVVIGLLLGGLFALRFEFAIPAIVAIVIVAVISLRRAAWRPLGIVGGVCVAAIAGWAVALERSSGTVLFPLFPGNYNESFPWEDPAFRTAGQFVSRLWGEVGTDGWGTEIVGLGVACVVILAACRRWFGPDRTTGTAVVVIAGVVGCAVLILSETRSLSGGVLADIGRYNTPSALAVALFAAEELWSLAAQPMLPAGEVPHPEPDPEPGPGRRTRIPALVCATMAVTLLAIPVGAEIPSGPPFGSAPRTLWYTTYDEALYSVKRLGGIYGNIDRMSPERPSYNAINAVIPRGANVLAAVELPGLLDFGRFRFATLDIAGAVSPAPGIPLTEGGQAVVSYLRSLGYDGIVASVTSSPGLDNYRDWTSNTASGIEDYRAMATEFVAWAHVLSQLAHNRSVHRIRIGTVEYLSWATPGGSR